MSPSCIPDAVPYSLPDAVPYALPDAVPYSLHEVCYLISPQPNEAGAAVLWTLQTLRFVNCPDPQDQRVAGTELKLGFV